jgi:hypothetical protein
VDIGGVDEVDGHGGSSPNRRKRGAVNITPVPRYGRVVL